MNSQVQRTPMKMATSRKVWFAAVGIFLVALARECPTFGAFYSVCGGNTTATERAHWLCHHDSGERLHGNRNTHCA